MPQKIHPRVARVVILHKHDLPRKVFSLRSTKPLPNFSVARNLVVLGISFR